jgi:predicted NBD/HSP70 family sugar kinase
MPDLDPAGRPRQLLHHASLTFLERDLAAAGADPRALTAADAADATATRVIEAWSHRAAPALARCIVTTASVIDVEAVVLDGLLDRRWLEALIDETRAALDGLNLSGISPFSIRAGSIGEQARVLGAALLPLQHRFAPDPDLVLRSAARAPDSASAA